MWNELYSSRDYDDAIICHTFSIYILKMTDHLLWVPGLSMFCYLQGMVGDDTDDYKRLDLPQYFSFSYVPTPT